MGKNIKKVAILFSGGPAPAANDVIAAAGISCVNAGKKVIGIMQGYKHLEEYSESKKLVAHRDYREFEMEDLTQARLRRDIIIKTSRANPGKPIKSPADLEDPAKASKLSNVLKALRSLNIDGLISIGGDDTLKTANYLYQYQRVTGEKDPISIIHVPKTIDNDYDGIDWTFGFMSAVNFISKSIINIAADARSTNSFFIVEIMGRKAGWLTYASGIAGGAIKMIAREDIATIKLDLAKMVDELSDLMIERAKSGKPYGVICIAEGLGEMLPDELRPKETDQHGNLLLRKANIGEILATNLEEALKKKAKKEKFAISAIKGVKEGYEARCANPTAFDKLLASQLGYGAYRAMIKLGLSGYMVSVENQLSHKVVPFGELIDKETLTTKIRFIPDGDFKNLARALEFRRKNE
jgi:6-phosphofructokinase 1